MPTEILRDEVRRLMAEDAQVVEVLGASQCRKMHLPGAVHIPLHRIPEDAAARLDRGRPVVVYCRDSG
jgi:rhodanese-related sulfurtransferase